MTLDYNNMDKYDIATLVAILADDAIEIYKSTLKREELEKKHKKNYYINTEWQHYSARYVELEYEYESIAREIIRRCKKND